MTANDPAPCIARSSAAIIYINIYIYMTDVTPPCTRWRTHSPTLEKIQRTPDMYVENAHFDIFNGRYVLESIFSRI